MAVEALLDGKTPNYPPVRDQYGAPERQRGRSTAENGTGNRAKAAGIYFHGGTGQRDGHDSSGPLPRRLPVGEPAKLTAAHSLPRVF